jgi:hypothetical protein
MSSMKREAICGCYAVFLLMPIEIMQASLSFPLIANDQNENICQLTDVKTGSTTVASMDSTGTDVYVSSSTNQLGTNPSHAFQLVRFTAATAAGAQLTTATDGISSGSFESIQAEVPVPTGRHWCTSLPLLP